MVRRRNDPARGWQQARPAHGTYKHERRGRHDRRLRDLGVGRRIFIQEARLRAIGAEHYHDQHPFHQLMRDGKLDRAYVISTAGLLPAIRFAVDAYVNFMRDRSLLGGGLIFRGTAWMAEPCRSCERREIDCGAVAAAHPSR